MSDSTMHYTFTMKDTQGTVGYVACEPPEDMTFDACLAYLEAHPMDDFMHKHLLLAINNIDQKRFKALLKDALGNATNNANGFARPVLASLLYEATLLYGKFSKLAHNFSEDAAEILKQYTPHPAIRWALQADKEAHRKWSERFRANIHEHRLLPLPDDTELPMLFEQESPKAVTAASVREDLLKVSSESSESPWQRPPAMETATLALERLLEHGFIGGQEMRHIASLSPIALLRQWPLNISANLGGVDYTLEGSATSYGRGLGLPDARAGYSMEMVERVSSFVSYDETGITERKSPAPVIKARHSELLATGKQALNPADIPLEIPYEDEPLHWVEGHSPTKDGDQTPVWVPVQMVSMFCNMDEVSLFSAPGSTGLASGNILEEAKLAALMEIIERDAEATQPYDTSRCFVLKTRDERLQALLDDYKARGVNIMFMDTTSEFGIPCYTTFVHGQRGEVTRGTGASLDGARAAISALTETPYPYPQSPPSGPVLRNLPEIYLEDLPSVAMEGAHRNLELVEKTLMANGRTPVYVELTREDLEFPVVKALIPGLELTADFDDFTRISKRLFSNYRNTFSK